MTERFHLTEFRDIGGKQYYISTTDILGDYYETMIFPAKDKEVTDWGELYGAGYNFQYEAENAHTAICELSDEDFLKLLE